MFDIKVTGDSILGKDDGTKSMPASFDRQFNYMRNLVEFFLWLLLLIFGCVVLPINENPFSCCGIYLYG